MENLLEQKRWQFAASWGSIVNPDTNQEIGMSAGLCRFYRDRVEFDITNSPTPGWKMDARWSVVQTTAKWGIGHMIAKDEYRTHYGRYVFTFQLPKFRGAWPAIWFVDMVHESNGGQGMPPEIDVFEHFRKDRFGTRFHTTHTFHHGVSYRLSETVQAVYNKLRGLWPVDLKEMTIEFEWYPNQMRWIVNGRVIMVVPATTSRYPTKPMNLLMGAGVGLDWRPQWDKVKPFVVTRAEYYPLGIPASGHIGVTAEDQVDSHTELSFTPCGRYKR
jgi:beta-glucanase (GH16 family)